MPSRVRCFLLTPTDEIEVSLRRYATSRGPCGWSAPRYPGGDSVTYDYHNVEVVIGTEHGTIEADLNGDTTKDTVARSDPRWPSRCGCGYVFRDDDDFQENRSRLYARSDGGDPTTTANAPAGALYSASWYADLDGYARNVAGESLVCKTPAGEWLIDGPASNGPGWTRSGAPPDIVVTPSIGIGAPQRMHGWLGGPAQNEPGWLVIDLP